MLEQITRGCEFGEDDACYVPVNDYVNKATKQMSAWLFQGTLGFDLIMSLAD